MLYCRKRPTRDLGDKEKYRCQNLPPWHFCSNCSDWPREDDRDERDDLPRAEQICPICAILQENDDCEQE